MQKIVKRVHSICVNRFSPVIRRLSHPDKYRTIGFLYEYLGESDSVLNQMAEAHFNEVVNEICTLDSRYESFYFPAQSACLVSDEDTARKAMRKGAVLLISPEDYEAYPCLISKNPILTFASLCRYYRDLSKDLYVTAISGSIGKTTVKNMMGEVYKMKYNTSYTRANLNTRMSVGFAVQHIPTHAKQLIQEIHEGNPDETRYISRMLHPDLFVLTPIDQSHFERFGSMQRIKEEICSITEYMQDGGRVIVDVDEFNDFGLLNGKEVITLSSKNDRQADFSINNVEVTPQGLVFKVYVKEMQTDYTVSLPNIYAPHNAQCALYAFAAGYTIGVEPERIVRGLQNYKTSGDRQNVFRTQDGVVVYADCYNAVGRSMLSAIDAANGIAVEGKRIAVLGDVAEAGSISLEMHREIVKQVNESDFSHLLTIGDEFRKALAEEPVREGLIIAQAKDLTELSHMIKSVVQKGDLVLFKASHSSNLSHCIKMVWPKEFGERIADTTNDEYNSWLKSVIKY